MSKIDEIKSRSDGWLTPGGGDSWERPKDDAVFLLLMLQARVSMLLQLNSTIPEPHDLCPKCAGYMWGRPSLPDGARNHHGGVQDYTRRMCSECGHIRTEPEE